MSSTRQSRLVRAAHVVGDFSNPFYREERHRDVWNEASAFGLQLVLWCTLLLCTGAVWLVGAPSVPYVGVALVLIGAVSWLTVAYASHLGVDLTGAEHVLRWRLLPYVVLVAVLAVGVVRAREEPLEASSVAGMLTGMVVGGLVVVLGLRWSRRA